MFRLALWLFDMSGKKLKAIKKEAIDQWCHAHLMAVKEQAITEWWRHHKAEREAAAVRAWKKERPVITVQVQQGIDDKWRFVIREADNDPIAVSAGFGFQELRLLHQMVDQLEMVTLKAEVLPRKVRKQKANGHTAEEKG